VWHLRTRPVHLAAALASVTVLGTALTACGADIPDDASAKDFCASSQTFATAHSFPAGVKAAGKLHHTGTPKGIPADARAGFELVVTLVGDAEDQNDLEKRYKALTAKQKGSVDALDAYITSTC
jgi:hypothetical protein